MKEISFVIILDLIFCISLVFAQEKPIPIEIFKSQQDIEEKERLDKKIWEGEKAFIGDITVTGANSLSLEKVNKAVEIFKNRWLSKSDIDSLQQTIVVCYQEAGLKERIHKIYYEIEGANLKINIEETPQVFLKP